MININAITPLILTYNEEANLGRTLAALPWAQQIVIVDSGSTDGTREIADACPRALFVERPFDRHANQWNFGLGQVTTEWTLALDADYVCPAELAEEFAALTNDADAFSAGFVYQAAGKPLRGTLYPSRIVLFRTSRFRYVQDGHTQVLDLHGATSGDLRSKIVHDDRKPLARWLASQVKYAALEAEKLRSTERRGLGWKDRVRRGIFWAPPLTLAYCLVWKRLILDGWPGIYYSLQRTYAELLLSLEILDRKLRPHAATHALQRTTDADASPSLVAPSPPQEAAP